MINLLNNPAKAVQTIVSHFNYMISESELIAYLEPFMVQGSITNVTDANNNKPLIARLTQNASFLPTASIRDIELFIGIVKQISVESTTLLRTVEGVLKNTISIVLEQCTHSKQWHNNAGFFTVRIAARISIVISFLFYHQRWVIIVIQMESLLGK